MSDKIITVASHQTEVVLERDGAVFHADGHEIEIVSAGGEELEIRLDGGHFIVPYAIDGSTVSFAFDGNIWFADVADRGAATRARHRDHSTAAPMPGVVLKTLVKLGDSVVRGAPLLILEAMKMEHQILSPRDGIVIALRCAEGEMVQPGLELVEIESEIGADQSGASE